MAACLKLHVLPLLAPVVLQLVICLATDAISFGLSSGSKKRTPATVTGPRTRATKKRSFGTSGNGSSSPFDTETNSPFMFLLRSAINNPVTYLHSVLVDQLVIVPCYYGNDGRQFGISNQLDMAWYRRLDSMHHPRTFPSINDGEGKLVVMEPIIGHNWFLCDTAFTSKVQHAKKYNMFYSEFKKGQLNMDWNYYQDFSEFSRGQFKHHLFANELAVTEIFVFMNATLKIFRSGASFDIEKLTRPQEMGQVCAWVPIQADLAQTARVRVSRDNMDQYCENPTVDILIPVFDNENSVTIQGKLKTLSIQSEVAQTWVPSRLLRIGKMLLNGPLEHHRQSIDLGPLGSLNPHPLLLTLVDHGKAAMLCAARGYHLKNQPWIPSPPQRRTPSVTCCRSGHLLKRLGQR
uniref:DDE Tnp4 domain-containing protein n=1 Tax=Macrostomum lignano TaxID=282301 RepID=A0A1I8JNA1_9PLAT